MTLHFTPFLKRVATGKLLGLCLGAFYVWGLAGASTLPVTLQWGTIGWAITLGAMIGLVGFYNRIPFFDVPLPTLLRGAMIGLWMGLLLVLLAYVPLQAAVAGIGWLPGMFGSAWWLLADAIIAGAVIDLVATLVAGRIDWRDSGLGGDMPS